MTGLTDKLVIYRSLVEERKACRACAELTNPSDRAFGKYDSDHIGPWSLWQGNLNAELMVIGQDWGDEKYFLANHGREKAHNPTNTMLRKLLKSINIHIEEPSAGDSQRGTLFLTNALLCLKREGRMQGATQKEWFEKCGGFLRRTIEIVQPKVIIVLGEQGYRAIATLYGLASAPFRAAVEFEEGFELPGGILLFPVYHCGKRILNTHRPEDRQCEDWARIKRALEQKRIATLPSTMSRN